MAASIVGLVLTELLGIVVISLIIGSFLSLAANWAISIHGVPIPMSITYGGMEFDRMYAEVNARSLYIPAVTVALSAIIVGILPALNAAKTDPARAMRTF